MFPARRGADGVQREACPLPIAATAQRPELAEDACFVLVFPFPDALHEDFAAEVMPGFFFLLIDEPLDHCLRGNARVVGARHVKGVETLHAPPTDEHILQGVIEGVPHVQGAGHVRGRNDDGERLPAIGLAVKITAAPSRNPATWPVLHGDRIVWQVRA